MLVTLIQLQAWLITLKPQFLLQLVLLFHHFLLRNETDSLKVLMCLIQFAAPPFIVTIIPWWSSSGFTSLSRYPSAAAIIVLKYFIHHPKQIV